MNEKPEAKQTDSDGDYLLEPRAGKAKQNAFPRLEGRAARQQYKELSDQFEELEQKMFGRDGFEDAVKRVAGIEAALGLSNLASFTAPPPPKR